MSKVKVTNVKDDRPLSSIGNRMAIRLEAPLLAMTIWVSSAIPAKSVGPATATPDPAATTEASQDPATSIPQKVDYGVDIEQAKYVVEYRNGSERYFHFAPDKECVDPSFDIEKVNFYEILQDVDPAIAASVDYTGPAPSGLFMGLPKINKNYGDAENTKEVSERVQIVTEALEKSKKDGVPIYNAITGAEFTEKELITIQQVLAGGYAAPDEAHMEVALSLVNEFAISLLNDLNLINFARYHANGEDTKDEVEAHMPLISYLDFMTFLMSDSPNGPFYELVVKVAKEAFSTTDKDKYLELYKQFAEIVYCTFAPNAPGYVINGQKYDSSCFSHQNDYLLVFLMQVFEAIAYGREEYLGFATVDKNGNVYYAYFQDVIDMNFANPCYLENLQMNPDSNVPANLATVIKTNAFGKGVIAGKTPGYYKANCFTQELYDKYIQAKGKLTFKQFDIHAYAVAGDGYENGKYEKSSVTGMSNDMGKAFALRYPGYNGAYPESYRGRYAQQMCVNPNTKGYTGRR